MQAVKEGRLRHSALQPDERMRRPGLSTLVLDEADLMLSMPGYEEDLQAIAPLVHLPHQLMHLRLLQHRTCRPQACHSEELLGALAPCRLYISCTPSTMQSPWQAMLQAEVDHYTCTCVKLMALYCVQVPRGCQCMLMSATMSADVERLQKLVLHNPITLNLLASGGSGKANPVQGSAAEIEHFSVSTDRYCRHSVLLTSDATDELTILWALAQHPGRHSLSSHG